EAADVQASAVGIQGAVQVQGEAQAVERLGGQLLVLHVEVGDLEAAGEAHPVLGEGEVHGRVDVGVAGSQDHGGGEDVGDLVEREPLGPQGQGPVGHPVGD